MNRQSCSRRQQMTQYFTDTGAGERYAAYRPKVHDVVCRWLDEHVPQRRFDRAVDVACGTGDSMFPLLKICDDVVGVDSSEEMLAIAKQRGLNVINADYAALPELGRFDLISTSMAFHWFDAAKAFLAYKAASAPGAIWIIYKFYFAGHSSSESFNKWFQDWYLNHYPTPPRRKAPQRMPNQDPDIRTLATEIGWLPISFTAESLAGYFSTQSNIEQAVREGQSLSAIQNELLRQLTAIDLSGDFKYAYDYSILEYTGS